MEEKTTDPAAERKNAAAEITDTSGGEPKQKVEMSVKPAATAPADKDKYSATNASEDESNGRQKQTADAFIHPEDSGPAVTPDGTKKAGNVTDPTAGRHAKAKENLSLLWTFLSTFVVACIVIAALGLVAVKVTGCYLFTIETGSMSPTYPVNTVVVVKPYSSFSEIQVGDVVTYLINEEGSTVTHRVISIDAADETVTTQGDANDIADASPVLYGNVVGKVVIGIPKIGGIVKVITADENRNMIIVIIVLLLAWAFLVDQVRKRIRKRRGKKKND